MAHFRMNGDESNDYMQITVAAAFLKLACAVLFPELYWIFRL